MIHTHTHTHTKCISRIIYLWNWKTTFTCLIRVGGCFAWKCIEFLYWVEFNQNNDFFTKSEHCMPQFIWKVSFMGQFISHSINSYTSKGWLKVNLSNEWIWIYERKKNLNQNQTFSVDYFFNDKAFWSKLCNKL